MAPLQRLLTCGLASALATQCAGDSCETENYDQTALLQSHLSRKSDLSLSQHSAQSAAFFPKLASLNDPHTRKSALLEIEKTAVKLANMDKTEATPVVIEVCTETAELLNTTVLYAIIEEDAADRASLIAAYDGFQQWEDKRAAAEAALEAAEAIVTQKADSLATCRMTETETCVNETICTTETNDHCTDRDRVEEELVLIDEEIHRSWCLDGAIRTSTEFRQTSSTIFRHYIDKLTELERLQLLCDEVLEHCETTLATYIAKATECNTKMNELQMASCEYHHVAAGELTAYQQGFQAALAFYNDVVARVMIEEADRKVEWDVLTRVICLLLTLTNEEDGVVSNGETEARIQRCWDDEVDVSHLDIDYRDPPPMLTLPELPPLPCTAEHEEHYDGMKPPDACLALIELHQTQADTECSCLADEIADQRLMLGHYLLVDPAIPMTVTNGQWTVEMDDATYSGQLSGMHTLDTATSQSFSNQMLTDDQMQEFEDDGSTNDEFTGLISVIAWAYPTGQHDWTGAMSLGQRFASRGGMVFLNSDSQVIDVRELASSSGTLGQPVANTLSFSSAEVITDEQVVSSGCNMHDVIEGSTHYQLGARHYCWVMDSALSQCTNGCFIYELVVAGGTEKVVFPVIGGMVISAQSD